jgi:uncharacterized phage protein (TIGR02218 family)
MKNASTAMQNHLANANPTTIAWLWKVVRTDGVILGFTSFDKDIVYDDGSGDGPITYLAHSGYSSSAVESKSNVSVDNVEVKGFLESDSITEQDLRDGKYDNALATMMIVNWADLTMGDVIMRTGTFGIVKMKNGLWTAEHRGLTYRFGTILGGIYGPRCRAVFGSGLNGINLTSQWLCMVDVTLYQQTGSVASVTDVFDIVPNSGLLQVGSSTPTAPAPAGWFDDGFITFTSGVLNGVSFEIKQWDGTTLALYLPMGPNLPSPSDAFIIEPGCNHTQYDCANKYNNIINFRGEDSIPGTDAILNIPNAS